MPTSVSLPPVPKLLGKYFKLKCGHITTSSVVFLCVS